MSAPSPLRVYCDFNDGDNEHGYWVLYYNDRPLSGQLGELGLSEGSRVILYQDDDWEVPGMIGRGRAFYGDGDAAWVAFPDWSRRVDFS